MLRVGLTGGLGSGKSTIAGMFARRGVYILEADHIGRELMQPGQLVYSTLLAHFGKYADAPKFLESDGTLDRAALAKYVFSTNRLGELNRLVHPAVIAEQERRIEAIFANNPNAIVMVESALIFEADRAGTAPGLSKRFDKLILVTAPEEIRLQRYIERVSGEQGLSAQERYTVEQDGRRRIGMQIKDEEKFALCDFVIENSGSIEKIELQVEQIFSELQGSRP